MIPMLDGHRFSVSSGQQSNRFRASSNSAAAFNASQAELKRFRPKLFEKRQNTECSQISKNNAVAFILFMFLRLRDLYSNPCAKENFELSIF